MAIVRLFDEMSVEDHANSLAHFLPPGRAWDAKWVDGTNFRQLLIGFAGEFLRLHDTLNLASQESVLSQINLRLTDWESALGIPDDCFDITGTIADRVRNVIVKFAMMNVSTEQDFIDLAALYGYTITIKSGLEEITFPLTFPIPMYSSLQDARFTMVVEVNTPAQGGFPYTFPITFPAQNTRLLECIFTKLVPATTAVQFKYIG